MQPGADIVKTCPECGRETSVRCVLGSNTWCCDQCYQTRIPRDDPRAPKYWMYETGGGLAQAVSRFVNQLLMSPADIALMRAYCRQWIDSPVWERAPHMTNAGRETLAELRHVVRKIETREQLATWLKVAGDYGADPL